MPIDDKALDEISYENLLKFSSVIFLSLLNSESHCVRELE